MPLYQKLDGLFRTFGNGFAFLIEFPGDFFKIRGGV